MKKTFLILLTFYSMLLFAQEQEIKKPEYIIIANNEIISHEQLDELGKQGLIKGMNKGVSEEEHLKLTQKFGDKIGDRDFIITIELFSEKEKTEQTESKVSTDHIAVNENKQSDELYLNTNDTAAIFTVEMINGETVNLSDLKGRIVLINFWATWCAPCLMEFAEFPDKILKPYNNEKFTLLAIAIGENKEKVQQKMQQMKKYGVAFNVGFDPTKAIWDQYANGAIPKNFIIDQKGIIRYVSIGNSEGNVDRLAKEIEQLLKH